MRLRLNWRYLLIGLLAYVIFLLAQFPADRAYAWWKAGPGAQQKLALTGLSGSVWQGGAQQALINGQRLQGLEWHLKPWTVLFGKLELDYEIRLNDGFARGSVATDPQGTVRLDAVEAKLPLAQLSLPAIAALRPSGVVNLNLQNVDWNGEALLAAQGRMVWSDAGISLLQPLQFGDLALTLETRDDGVIGELSDAGGPLQAEGLITLKADGSYQFTGSFAAREGAQSPLGQALGALGRPGADGRIQVNQSGQLAALGLGSGRR
ncbi:MAG TPA: type II secretion system protein N [Chromatiales bacterium]|nr:type II secretion system protein N [Chromatiales bacterium]HEX21983.1 type II secretion system protein N [Chromatiales bacterium]